MKHILLQNLNVEKLKVYNGCKRKIFYLGLCGSDETAVSLVSS